MALRRCTCIVHLLQRVFGLEVRVIVDDPTCPFHHRRT